MLLHPGSTGGGSNDRVGSLAWQLRLPTSGQRVAVASSKSEQHPQSQESATDGNGEEAPPAFPRIAWSAGGGGEAGEEKSEGSAWTAEGPMAAPMATSDILDVAMQIRRDLLAFRISSEYQATEAGDGEGIRNNNSSTNGGSGDDANSFNEMRSILRTPDGCKSLRDMENSLAQAGQRAEARRRELGSYLVDLQSRTFAPPDAADEEPLVVLPGDFDDAVDMNTQHATLQRRQGAWSGKQGRGGGAGGSGGLGRRGVSSGLDLGMAENCMTEHGGSSSSTSSAGGGGGSGGGFQLPDFLDKYFDDDKAAEQLPHKQLEDMEVKAKGGAESELQKALRQVAKLDGLLAKREALGAARVQAAHQEFEQHKAKLQREAEMTEDTKRLVLQRLKQRGLLHGSAGSSRASSKSTSLVSSTRASITDGGSCTTRPSRLEASVTMVALATTSAPRAALADWSGWTSTASAEEQQSQLGTIESTTPRPPTEGGFSDRPATADSSVAEAAEDEADIHTFLLTSMTTSAEDLFSTPFSWQASAASRSNAVIDSFAAAQGPTGAQRMASSRESLAELALATIDEDSEDLVALDKEVEEALMHDGENEDPYTSPESLEALRSIDERLQRIVPESEWEAKSISSLPSGSVAGSMSNSADGSQRSRRPGSKAALPGELVLREQAESSDLAAQLRQVDQQIDQLRLQAEEAVPATLDRQVVQDLLLQAAQETTPLDSAEKVLAALADCRSRPGSRHGKHSGQLIPVLQDAGPLEQAHQILRAISDYDREHELTARDTELCIEQLEADVRNLEEEAVPTVDSVVGDNATSPVTRSPTRTDGDAANATNDSSPEQLLALRPVAEQLEALSVQAAAMAEMQIPRLAGADDLEQDLAAVEDGELSSIGDDLEPTQFAYSDLGSYVGLNREPVRALDIQLPTDGDEWDDAELERIVRTVDQHFGDILPELPVEADNVDARLEVTEGVHDLHSVG